jgi:hypothetical protein
MMVRSLLIVALIALTLFASPAEDCSPCVGFVAGLTEDPPDDVPLLVTVAEGDPDFPRAIERLTPQQRARTVLVIDFALEPDESLDEIDQRLRGLAREIARGRALRAAGLRIPSDPSPQIAWSARRLAVILQSERAAEQSLVAPASLEALDHLVEERATPYFDILLIAPPVSVEAALLWVIEHDPSKRIHAVVTPVSPNPLFDAAEILAGGAEVAYLSTSGEETVLAAIHLDREFAGDWTADSTSRARMLTATGAEDREQRVVTFVRGEDLRTVVVPQGTAAPAAILAVPAIDFTAPRLLSAEGFSEVTDTGERGGDLLVGLSPLAVPFAIFFDRPRIESPALQKETLEVTGSRSIPVEEIVREHQAYWDFQRQHEPAYIATNETSLRFAVGSAGDSVEATLAGSHFFRRPLISDWTWENLYLNGVRWRYGRIPELPLVEPEKVSQLPLEIELSREYRYELVRETERNGYKTWEVAFEPPADAPSDLPLYRGRVWIDRDTHARVAISMIQLNLSGNVLSNEEAIEYAPFDRSHWKRLTPLETRASAPRDLLWLPVRISAQQTVSAGGRATPVQRSTVFSRFEIDPERFDGRRIEAHRSPYRMVRETEEGLRYLEPAEGDERLVKEGVDTSRLFLVGGIQHDEGLEYGVLPLGGVNYFNYDLWGKGLQTNVFFAGVVAAVNLTDPSFRNTRMNLGADAFALAIPFENSIFRGGVEIEEEAVEIHPLSLSLRAGHPVLTFGKLDASLGMTWVGFGRATTTADDFEIPADTFVLSPAIHARYDRWGYGLAAFFEHNHRMRWEPWGVADEFDERQQSYDKYGLALTKVVHLPKFQRIGIGLEWVSGSDLDRFSKYELGFWGSTRVRGFASQSVRAEEAWLGHLSYGLVLSDAIRMEAFYDLARLNDTASGLEGEIFQGVGVGGQMVGPWGTLLRFDLGRSVGANRQDGFVASILFLKLFD